jgi:hypothetical protein
MQDLIKANEGNPNQREDDPTMIHWGKYNMIGRFIGTVVQCQTQCRSSPSYRWTERRDIAELLRDRTLMNPEVSAIYTIFLSILTLLDARSSTQYTRAF